MKKGLPMLSKALFSPSQRLLDIIFGCLLLLLSFLCLNSIAQTVTPNIRLDQFGYPINARKVAVIANPINGYNNNLTFTPGSVYQVKKVSDNSVVYTGMPAAWKGGALHVQSGDKVWWFDFSNITTPGSYYILDVQKNVKSYEFNIGDDVYDNVAKAASKMFYYNRRGFAKVAPYSGIWTDPNPAFNNAGQDLNARLVTDKTNSSTERDVSGGWFDAGDYNKYTNFTFSVFSDLLLAYDERPSVWTDNANIPESGNGIPDLLDEIKWEMDWLLKMQNVDGSVLSKVGNAIGVNMTQLPPSNITAAQYYGPSSTSATLTGAMAFALGAIQYKSLTSNTAMVTYGNTLQTAAINAWNWADANPSVLFVNVGNFDSADPEVDNYTRTGFKIAASVYLYALTGDNTYKTYFDANYAQLNCVKSGNFISLYEQHFQDAVIYYTKISGATPSVVTNIKSKFQVANTNQSDKLPAFINQDDAYRSHINDSDYNWGSSKIKSCGANNLNDMIVYNIDATNVERYRESSLAFIHYMHGTNATGYSFLTNMGSYGAENAITKIYHAWFGASGSFSGNTPPGYVAGGVNKSYKPDASYSGPALIPPMNQPAAKSYKDWDTSWPENSWEITEPGIYYQAAYLRMLSKGMGGVPAPPVDAVNPSVPSGLVSSVLLPQSFTLSWTASTDNMDVVAYEIYDNGTKIFESTSNTMMLTGLTPNTTYVLTVKAKDRAGNLSSASSSITVTTPFLDTEAPTAPTNLAASNTTQVSTILTWTASTDNLGVTEYEIFKDGNSVGTTTNLIFPVSGLTANTTYSFTVKARDASNNISVASAALSLTTTNVVTPDKVLFDEAVLAGWSSGGWNTVQNFASTSPVKVGSIAAKQSYNSWEAFTINANPSSNAIYTATYPQGIGFWAYAEGSVSERIGVRTFDINGTESQSIKAVIIPSQVWTYVTIPWSDLGNPTSVKDIWFQEFSGSLNGRTAVINFDEIKFLYSTPPNLTNDVVYENSALNAGWGNWSYGFGNGNGLNFSNTTPGEFKNGTSAIKVTAPANATMSLHRDNGPFQTSNYLGGFQFWAYGKTAEAGNTTVKLKVFPEGGTTEPSGSGVEKLLDIPLDTWTLITIPWAELGGFTSTDRLNIQSNSTNEQVFFLDDIRLLAEVPLAQVADVTFSPVGGTFTAAQTVTLATTTSGATIRYTTDGSTPTETVGTIYTAPLSVGATTTVKAIAYKSGATTSAVTSQTYTIAKPNNVIFDDALGAGWNDWSFDGTTDFDFANTTPVKNGTISIKMAPVGAWRQASFESNTAYNTADFLGGIQFWAYGGAANGTNTTAKIKVYTENDGTVVGGTLSKEIDLPLGQWTLVNVTWAELGNPTQIKRLDIQDISGASGQIVYLDDVSLIGEAPVANVTYSPIGGTFTVAQNVSLSTATPGASIRYTTDGSTPTETMGTVFTAPINVAATATIKAIAYKSGVTSSQVTSQTYTINTIVNTTDEIIYGDALASGWNNWSYDGSDWEFTNTTRVKVGTNSIKGAPAGAWKAASFNKNTVVSTSDYPGGIGFWAYGDTPNGTNTTVKIQVFTQATSSAANSTSKSVDLPVGVWTYVNVSLADLGNPTDIQRVNIQDVSGAAGQVMYFDEVKLLATVPTFVSNPTFSPADGTFSTVQSVSLATTTAGASIRYTTDGSTPSETVGTVYAAPISVGTTTTIKAIAYKVGAITSNVSSATYTIAFADQIVYADALGVDWNNWSYDGSDWDFANTSKVKVGTNSIKGAPAGAWKAASFNKNTVANTVDYPAGIGFWAYGETANGTNTQVKIQLFTQATSSAPNSTSKAIDLPLGVWTYINVSWADLGNPTDVQRINIQDASGAAGQVMYFDEIRLLATTPTYVANTSFSPAGGTFTSAQNVSLASATSGASIRYTTDGSIPSETVGTVYSAPITVGTTKTIKAIAYKAGSIESAVTMETYTINIPVAFETTKAGDWNDPTVWLTGTVPTLTDDVIIKHSVSITTNAHAKKVSYLGGTINIIGTAILSLGL